MNEKLKDFFREFFWEFFGELTELKELKTIALQWIYWS